MLIESSIEDGCHRFHTGKRFYEDNETIEVNFPRDEVT